jgi:Domain of unknown function (DUF4865)
MLALHYEVTLPADYDMSIIRERVATRGSALDSFPGLRFKAYLIREAHVLGAPVNQYAPFYVWNTEEAMASFLWGGGGFGSITSDFGRPSGQTWVVLDTGDGPARDSVPVAAVRDTRTLPPFVDPQPAAEQAGRWLTDQLGREHLHSVVVALDPRTWQVVRFTLWDAPQPDEPGAHFEVLHLSAPETYRLL